MIKMDVVLLAGGRLSPDDPLNTECQEGVRSLINIHGKPMVQWVIDALAVCDATRDIYIIGLSQEHNLTASKPLHFLPDEGHLFDNIRAGALRAAQDHPSQPKVMIASSDIPAIRAEVVNWLVEQVVQDPTALIYYCVIPQSVMDARYPDSGRSFVRFRDISVCGGDLNVIDHNLFSEEKPIWKQITDARKHPLKQVRLLGLGSLILIALHLLTLDRAVEMVCKKLSLDARTLITPFAEMGMDADKPNQLAILRGDMESSL